MWIVLALGVGAWWLFFHKERGIYQLTMRAAARRSEGDPANVVHTLQTMGFITPMVFDPPNPPPDPYVWYASVTYEGDPKKVLDLPELRIIDIQRMG